MHNAERMSNKVKLGQSYIAVVKKFTGLGSDHLSDVNKAGIYP
jgi:hypothetical protein